MSGTRRVSHAIVTLVFDDGVDRVVRLLHHTTQPVKVVAIDGHSAAGNSTFAARLTERMPGAVVHGDDFYRVMDEDKRASLSPPEGAAQYYDWQRLRDEVLVPLRGGRPARFRPYDWDTNALADETVTIGPERLIIVEGLFVSRLELAHLVDVMVLVCADTDVRWRRQLARRDAGRQWLERWDAAERWYFEYVRPPESFDVLATDAGSP